MSEAISGHELVGTGTLLADPRDGRFSVLIHLSAPSAPFVGTVAEVATDGNLYVRLNETLEGATHATGWLETPGAARSAGRAMAANASSLGVGSALGVLKIFDTSGVTIHKTSGTYEGQMVVVYSLELTSRQMAAAVARAGASRTVAFREFGRVPGQDLLTLYVGADGQLREERTKFVAWQSPYVVHFSVSTRFTYLRAAPPISAPPAAQVRIAR